MATSSSKAETPPESAPGRPDDIPDFSAKELVLDRPGVFVGKHSERIRVFAQKEIVEERPLFGLEHILVASGGVSLSSDVVRECAERGIQISFITPTGKPYARLVSPELVGTIRTRREQLLAYTDARGVTLAKAFASGKLLNQANLLKYMAKYRAGTDKSLHEGAREAAFELEDLSRHVEEVESLTVDDARETILNLEGRGAARYWEAARALVAPDIDWPGRETRGAQDLVNSLLNYGYGILYSHVERAVILAGLDPYAGFLHADRAGKPSLVLDMVEEFRQPVVDRTVFAMLNLKVKVEVQEGMLTEATRRALASRVQERLDAAEPHDGERHKLRSIMQAQARRLATFVRGERDTYKTFVGRW